ncbi:MULTISPECIES: inovirus Gp2 family protein [Serratia]|uniref:inovirus Gp2 family protein n=1 Tax=Serratia TaxID=613 RepID=UPI00080BD274|nr:inovirus Gp2 family protein [Serratia sp. 506_PEND]
MSKYMISKGKLNKYQLKRIEETIDNALVKHPRITSLRIDLHTPLIEHDVVNNDMPDETYFVKIDSSVISRFIASLKAIIKAYIKAKEKDGIRVHKTSVGFLWVREFTPTSSKKHYHLLLLLNKDTFNYVGNFNEDKGALVSFIHRAWMSALGLTYPYYRQLVHLAKNGCFYLNAKDGKESEEYKRLIFATSYFAKEYSKCFTDGERNFGCSQK